MKLSENCLYRDLKLLTKDDSKDKSEICSSDSAQDIQSAFCPAMDINGWQERKKYLSRNSLL